MAFRDNSPESLTNTSPSGARRLLARVLAVAAGSQRGDARRTQCVSCGHAKRDALQARSNRCRQRMMASKGTRLRHRAQNRQLWPRGWLC
jgi:hypothetical protein